MPLGNKYELGQVVTYEGQLHFVGGIRVRPMYNMHSWEYDLVRPTAMYSRELVLSDLEKLSPYDFHIFDYGPRYTHEWVDESEIRPKDQETEQRVNLLKKKLFRLDESRLEIRKELDLLTMYERMRADNTRPVADDGDSGSGFAPEEEK